jgi:hypothetical protein
MTGHVDRELAKARLHGGVRHGLFMAATAQVQFNAVRDMLGKGTTTTSPQSSRQPGRQSRARQHG